MHSDHEQVRQPRCHNRLGAPARLYESSEMNLSLRHCILVLTVFTASIVVAAESSAPEFLAAAARRDITPKEPMPMWGYGARHAALSTGALDPLYATAL